MLNLMSIVDSVFGKPGVTAIADAVAPAIAQRIVMPALATELRAELVPEQRRLIAIALLHHQPELVNKQMTVSQRNALRVLSSCNSQKKLAAFLGG